MRLTQKIFNQAIMEAMEGGLVPLGTIEPTQMTSGLPTTEVDGEMFAIRQEVAQEASELADFMHSAGRIFDDFLAPHVDSIADALQSENAAESVGVSLAGTFLMSFRAGWLAAQMAAKEAM